MTHPSHVLLFGFLCFVFVSSPPRQIIGPAAAGPPGAEPVLSDIGPSVSCILDVPPGTCACGVFQDNRSLEMEYALLSRAGFLRGSHVLPAAEGDYRYELLESLELGPDRILGVTDAPGTLTLTINQSGETTWYTYKFVQTFRFGLSQLELSLENLTFTDRGEGPPPKQLDQEIMNLRLYMYGSIDLGGAWPESIRYSSCTYQSLPLWYITVDLAGGEEVLLHQRFQQPMAGSGPANLVRGEVWLEEGNAAVNDYWHLVYAAEHHNWNEKFWILLDPPLGEIHCVEVRLGDFGDPDEVIYLDGKLNPLRQPRIERIDKFLAPATAPQWIVR